MFSKLLSFLLASAAALRRGRFSAGSIPLFCLGTSCCSSLLLLGSIYRKIMTEDDCVKFQDDLLSAAS